MIRKRETHTAYIHTTSKQVVEFSHADRSRPQKLVHEHQRSSISLFAFLSLIRYVNQSQVTRLLLFPLLFVHSSLEIEFNKVDEIQIEICDACFFLCRGISLFFTSISICPNRSHTLLAPFSHIRTSHIIFLVVVSKCCSANDDIKL